MSRGRKWAVGLGVLAVVGIAMPKPDAGTATEDPAKPDTVALREREDRQLMRNAETAMRDRLKDPESARFHDLVVARFSGAPVVCGHVNAKNSFGGYSGKKAFVYVSGAPIGEDDLAADAFNQQWNRLCTP
jgi:hypothetical protein